MQDPDEYDWVIAYFIGFVSKRLKGTTKKITTQKYALFSPWLILGMVLHIFYILRGYVKFILFLNLVP